MYTPKSAYFRSSLVFGVVVLGLSTCNHPTALQIGQPYTLRTINGRPLPYLVNGTADGPVLTKGSMTFLGGSQAERSERMRMRGATPADSVIMEWTQPGTFYNQVGRVVVRYTNWVPGQSNGPRAAADTFEATSTGGFTLRQAGLVLQFCPESSDC